MGVSLSRDQVCARAQRERRNFSDRYPLSSKHVSHRIRRNCSLLVWLVVFLRTKGESFTFDPGGKDGEFGKTLLPVHLDIAKFVLGLAPASIVFCLFGSSNLGQPGARPLRAFASPLFLVAMSIIYGVLFMIFLVLNYENHQNQPQSNS
jgi:hypothetical protein